MAGNTTPLVPKDEITGHAVLPISRVKKIMAIDDELSTTPCSNTAAFAITIATQHFLTYLVTQTHNVVRAERKPRKTIQYGDVANAIAKTDNLEFLADVVPRTTTYKAHVSKRGKRGRNGTQTLEAVTLPVSKLPDVGKMAFDGAEHVDNGELPAEASDGRVDLAAVNRRGQGQGQGPDPGTLSEASTDGRRDEEMAG